MSHEEIAREPLYTLDTPTFERLRNWTAGVASGPSQKIHTSTGSFLMARASVLVPPPTRHGGLPPLEVSRTIADPSDWDGTMTLRFTTTPPAPPSTVWY